MSTTTHSRGSALSRLYRTRWFMPSFALFIGLADRSARSGSAATSARAWPRSGSSPSWPRCSTSAAALGDARRHRRSRARRALGEDRPARHGARRYRARDGHHRRLPRRGRPGPRRQPVLRARRNRRPRLHPRGRLLALALLAIDGDQEVLGLDAGRARPSPASRSAHELPEGRDELIASGPGARARCGPSRTARSVRSTPAPPPRPTRTPARRRSRAIDGDAPAAPNISRTCSSTPHSGGGCTPGGGGGMNGR